MIYIFSSSFNSLYFREIRNNNNIPNFNNNIPNFSIPFDLSSDIYEKLLQCFFSFYNFHNLLPLFEPQLERFTLDFNLTGLNIFFISLLHEVYKIILLVITLKIISTERVVERKELI